MQAPPPLQLVLSAMRPVGNKVKYHQVNKQTDHGLVSNARPQLVKVKRAIARRTQSAENLLEPSIQGKKQRQFEQPEPVNQGIENIDADAGTIARRSHPLHRPPAL